MHITLYAEDNGFLRTVVRLQLFSGSARDTSAGGCPLAESPNNSAVPINRGPERGVHVIDWHTSVVPKRIVRTVTRLVNN
jgi:hypothetical protein